MNTEVQYIDITMSETEEYIREPTTKHLKHSISQEEIYQQAAEEKCYYSGLEEDFETIKVIDTKPKDRKTDGCYINGKFNSKLYNDKFKEELRQKRQAKTKICEGCGMRINSYYEDKHRLTQAHRRTVEFIKLKMKNYVPAIPSEKTENVNKVK